MKRLLLFSQWTNLHHRTEVEEYMARNQLKGEQLRVEHERRFPPTGIRERLLTRRASARDTEQ